MTDITEGFDKAHAIRIKDADESTVEELFSLERECFGDEAWSRESIRGALDNDSYITVAVRRGGALAAMACAVAVRDEAEITKVAVLPEFRRQGLARLALDELSRLLSESGVKRLLLEVREGNTAALTLYGSLGFTKYSSRRGYYASPREDAVLMEKRI